MRIMLLIFLLLFAALVWAADNPVAQQEPDEAEPESGGQEQTELILDETEPGDDEESPERFIPTEEISQDLGVSFPVDI